MSIEKRYLKELRASNGAGDQMILEGYAARFNSPSKDLGGFRETIAPGAFKRALAENADVRCLFNHSADKVLGRTASGTLTINEDDKGLHFRCMLDPNNTDHRNLHSSVKRGDINECSFAFTPNGPDGEDWQNVKDERGNWFISRMLKDVNLYDVSAVTHPAYDNTSVQARAAEVLTVEVRSHISETLQKRAGMLGTTEKRDKSVQDMLNCISQCLSAQYPCENTNNGACCPSYGMYWICDTYDSYVIASKDCAGPAEYYKITYVPKPDGDGYVFGEPTPVEKEWVPSERSKSIVGEQRAMSAAHMQMIADQHSQTAAAHTDAANEHSAVADAHTAHAEAHQSAADHAQTEADRMAKCEDTNGDCSVKGCRCQNNMVSMREMDDDYEDWEDFEGDDNDDEDEDKKNARRSARKAAEVRGGPGSGPRPGEGAKTKEEHDAAAAYHIAAAEHETGNAKESHNDAAKAHIRASASAAKADAADKSVNHMEKLVGKGQDKEGRETAAKAHAVADKMSAKANDASKYTKAYYRAEIDSAEVRADGSDKVRTKTVGGKALPKSAFAVVGDPNDTSTWKLPVHDKAHADNAAARLNQTNDVDKEAADKKIKAAQKKFGESPDDRAFREEMELRFRLSMAL